MLEFALKQTLKITMIIIFRLKQWLQYLLQYLLQCKNETICAYTCVNVLKHTCSYWFSIFRDDAYTTDSDTDINQNYVTYID